MDDLMLAVLESQNRWLQANFRGLVERRAGTAPRDQLLGLLEVVADIIRADTFQGCIFVNAAMEFPLPHQAVHRAAADHKAAIEAIVAEIPLRAGASDPAALARELCLVMEGVARRVAQAVIETHLGAEPKPERP